MTLDTEGLSQNSIVLIGERTNSSLGSIISWGKQFDGASYQSNVKPYTEGQFRALFLRIRRLILKPEFSYNKVFAIGDDEDIIIVENQLANRILLVCVLLRKEKYQFNEALVEIINNIASRAGIYTAKKFHSEIFEAIDRQQNDTEEDNVFEQITTREALIYLETKDLTNTSKELMSNMINVLTTSEENKEKYIHSKHVFEAVLIMLNKIKKDDDPDITLDSAYLIATKYKSATRFYFASKTFGKIADLANKFDRLALEISSRIQMADIIKIQKDQEPSEIINTLVSIDDGSLEVASPYDREVYYCMHGYAYDKLDDQQTAEDFYLMATMIAEMDGPNSIYIAEAHSFIAKRHFERYEVDNAIREFLTAASIAQANLEPDVATTYTHQAGLSELVWSKMLASTSIILRMEGNTNDAEYHAWKALKHLMKGILYTHRDLRKNELEEYYLEIIKMTEEVLTQSYDEYTLKTIEELRENFEVLSTGSLPQLQEIELLKFLQTKISAKLPLPNPIIMIIATDGRLIVGGEIGKEDWSQAFGSNDDLFSGALSAIMAILSEVISTSNPLRMVDAGTTSIMIEKSDNCIGALLIDRDDIILRRALKDVLMKISIAYPGLSEWDGYSIDFSDLKPMINERFSQALNELSYV